MSTDVLSVFYDLETSDRNPIGQILNYCFIAVDEEWREVGRCQGLIRCSRLQLPDPEAIRANRIDLLQHQKEASDDEPRALRKIVEFLTGIEKKSSSPVPLIGYNSSRFDLNYLRTSLIRNGFNPYFRGRLPPKDLLQVAQLLYIRSEAFGALMRRHAEEHGKLSLRLEAVATELDLLTGVQAHESSADVLLTIEVARQCLLRYGVDVRRAETFEAAQLVNERFHGIVLAESPEYDLSSGARVRVAELALVDGDNRSSLWVDLGGGSSDPRENVRWYSNQRHAFFLKQTVTTPTTAQVERLEAVKRALRGVTMRNFFTRSTCDIELDIYRLDFDAMDILIRAISNGDGEEIRMSDNRDLKILWSRYRLAHARELDERGRKNLRDYALHRYGGKLQISKNPPREGELEFHATLASYMTIIDQARAVARESSDEFVRETARLLTNLRSYYLSSEVWTLCSGANGFEGQSVE